jgi:hypothetical protein
MRAWLSWEAVTVMIVVFVPFGWLYPLFRVGARFCARRMAPAPVYLRRRGR